MILTHLNHGRTKPSVTYCSVQWDSLDLKLDLMICNIDFNFILSFIVECRFGDVNGSYFKMTGLLN